MSSNYGMLINLSGPPGDNIAVLAGLPMIIGHEKVALNSFSANWIKVASKF